jgi:hypothetical protein
MRSSVEVYNHEGRYYLGGGEEYYAEWKTVTVGLWDKIKQDGIDLSEINIWKYALKESNLLDGVEETHTEEGFLTDESIECILQFRPAFIPLKLVGHVTSEVVVTRAEELRIERECDILWSGNGSSLKDPSIHVERAILGIMMHEKYGIPSYASISDMPEKVYRVYRLVANLSDQIQKRNMDSSHLNKLAKQAVGIR